MCIGDPPESRGFPVLEKPRPPSGKQDSTSWCILDSPLSLYDVRLPVIHEGSWEHRAHRVGYDATTCDSKRGSRKVLGVLYRTWKACLPIHLEGGGAQTRDSRRAFKIAPRQRNILRGNIPDYSDRNKRNFRNFNNCSYSKPDFSKYFLSL